MIISDKMKPVIITLLVILFVLLGIRCYQKIHQPKQHVKTEAQEMLEVWTTYLIDLQKHIKSNISFDDSGFFADVAFNIDKSGNVSNIQVTQTSKNDKFDDKVVAAVKKSSPCPSLPGKYKGNGVTVNLTLGKEISGSQIIKEW